MHFFFGWFVVGAVFLFDVVYLCCRVFFVLGWQFLFGGGATKL